MTSRPDEKLITRIRRLMTVSTSVGYSEAEAAFAAEQVQRLLVEHNLSMAVVEASGGEVSEGAKRTRDTLKRRQVYKWQRRLMAHVAKLNFCVVYERVERRWKKADIFDGYDLIGRVDNVAATTVMFDYLLEAIERLARDFAGSPLRYFVRSTHSFREGCADRLTQRLEAQSIQMQAESRCKREEEEARMKHPSAAKSNVPMVVLEDVIAREADLNNDFVNGWEPGTTAENRRHREAVKINRGKEALELGLNEDEAFYYVIGYSAEQAREFVADWLSNAKEVSKPETEAQRRKRETKEQRARERADASRCRQQRKEHDRLDWNAYSQGAEAGDTVSLNKQVDEDKRRLT